MKTFIILFVFFTFFGCNTQKNNPEVSNKRFLKDSIFLNVNSRIYDKSLKKTFSIKQNNYLSVLDKRNSTFQIYNIETFDLIFVKKNIPNCKEIIDYDIHNFDTVYILKNKNIIELSDTGFISKKQYIVNDISAEFNNGYELFCSAYYHPLTVKGKYAYVFHYPLNVLDTKEKLYNYFSKKPELKIKLNGKAKIIDYSGFFPQIYKRDIFNSYNMYRIFNDNYEIFSFDICDTVFLVKNKSEIKKAVASNYYSKRAVFDFSKVKDYNYIKKYLVENPNYGQLLYDKYKKKYYRVCKHGMNYENKDGSVNIPGDEDWSLIITESNFNIQNEILFDSNFSRRNILITPKGVLIKKNNENEKTKFYIFDF